MSLLVWLPLDGNLNNLGCSNITYSGTPTYKTGKIGAQALNINSRVTITCDALKSLKTFSICFWGMSEASETLTGNWQDLIGFTDVNSSGTNGTFRWESGYSGYPGIHWHDNATNAFVNGSATHINVHGTWCHCCVVFDYEQGKLYTYANGILIGTHTHAGGHFNTSGQFYLGQTNAIEGRITDVRIYNHALSAAEVHEISQGLVLHYKLNTILKNFSTNTKTEWTNINMGQWYQTIFSINMTDFLSMTGAKNGNKFTFSIDINAMSGKKPICARVQHFNTDSDRNSVVGNAIAAGTSGRSSVTFTVNTNYTRLDFAITNGNTSVTSTNTEQYKCTTIVWGEIDIGYIPTTATPYIQDSSGYNHSGTINGTMALNTSTARQNTSLKFNGVDNAILVPFNNIIKDITYTISVWTYKTVIGDKAYQTIFGGPSGFELEARSNTTTNPLYRIHNWGGGTTAYEFNKWNLFTFVHTPDNAKLYVNGELKITGTANAKIPSGNYYIGSWRDTTSQNYEGQMSDFRIYCTALSAEDVKSLYQVGAKIDNKGNIHSYEFNEDNIYQLSKTGILNNPLYIEEYKLVQNRGWSFNPTGANNSCAGNITVDFSAFTGLHRSIILTLEGDISWSNIAPTGEGTFAAYFQGDNRKVADNKWAWAGANYAHPGTNQTAAMTANATGSEHFVITKTIPATWFDTYNGSHVSYRTNYTKGTITLSNFSVTVTFANAQIGITAATGKNLIEF